MPNRIATHAIFALLAALLLATPGRAADVVAVRVGDHPTYTRVVFQLDAPAGYGIERRTAEDGTSEILVRMDAGSTPRSLDRRTVMVERISVEGGQDRSTARIRLRKSPSRVRELILTNPPRLAFDLVFPEPMLAAAKRRTAEKAALAQAPGAEPDPKAAPPSSAGKPTLKADVLPGAKPTLKADVPRGAKPTLKADVLPGVKPTAEAVVPPGAKPRAKADVLPGVKPTASADVDWVFYGSFLAGGILLAIFVATWLRRRSLPSDVEVTAVANSVAADDRREIAATDGDSEASEATPEMPRAGFAGVEVDVARRLLEFERRVEQVEARLDTSSDARERLERQVAAQGEELRVQRSAIARTQRALRSLSRGDAEEATEPARRDGDS